ncbi:MAG: uracil-DNA glycosylase family protein [Pseudomonadota bacterium]
MIPQPNSSELSDLSAEIAKCRLCADRFAKTETAHEPRPVAVPSTTARLLIAGQAPGARVHASGIPFDDRSGDRLRDWLGVDRPVFYDPSKLAIVPMAFCFPGYDAKGSDLPPPKLCAQTWRDRLMATMPQVELTLLIGQYAQQWHMGQAKKRTLTDTVRAWREYGPNLLPLPHPSWRNTGWLKRNPWFAEEVLPWLRSEVSRLVA